MPGSYYKLKGVACSVIYVPYVRLFHWTNDTRYSGVLASYWNITGKRDIIITYND